MDPVEARTDKEIELKVKKILIHKKIHELLHSIKNEYQEQQLERQSQRQQK